MGMRSLRNRLTISILVALLLAACTSTTATTAPPEEDTPPATDLAFSDDSDQLLIDEPPSTTLAVDAPLVLFEAVWLCELQRRTFTTPDAVNSALNQALDEADLDQAEYEAFRERVNVEQELRDSVLFAYQETCVLR